MRAVLGKEIGAFAAHGLGVLRVFAGPGAVTLGVRRPGEERLRQSTISTEGARALAALFGQAADFAAKPEPADAGEHRTGATLAAIAAVDPRGDDAKEAAEIVSTLGEVLGVAVRLARENHISVAAMVTMLRALFTRYEQLQQGKDGAH